MRLIDPDMRVILDGLRDIADPYVRQALFTMDTAIDSALRVENALPTVNGNASYSYKTMDFFLYLLFE